MPCTFSVAGRLTAHRGAGKAIFADVRDESGRVQVYARINDLGEDAFRQFKDLDLGDIVGVRGFRSIRARASRASTLQNSRCLPKPCAPRRSASRTIKGEPTTRFPTRKSGIGIAISTCLPTPTSRDVLTKRSKVVSTMRRFLEEQGFLEVETPVLQLVAGGAAARPFMTHHNALDHDFKLRISLELYLKRLIIGGYEKVFEIGRVFRNEGMSTRHNPEFTLMELYQAYADLEDIMELVEAMYETICLANQRRSRTFVMEVRAEARRVEVTKMSAGLLIPPRLPMLEGIAQYAGIAPERNDRSGNGQSRVSPHQSALCAWTRKTRLAA